MHKIFETLRFNRRTYLDFLDQYSLKQLNNIPQNFNNSMIWNIIHTVVTEQLLIYDLSGLPMKIDEEYISRFRKGTKPEKDVTAEEVLYIKNNMMKLIDMTEEDYKSGIFKNYTPYLSSTDISLNTVDEALKFNLFHEGIHLGVILSIKKLV
ncbi:MAG: DinB family protein [Flavobacteriia bacterium]|nr:MAG: DinB family protein [Flavobacteriia bacterium]